MYKQPQNLKDMLELQKVLDNSINGARERTLDDIKLSMIAEIIEFNEETKYSHKTWKTKPYNKEKELEELADVWFFMCQLVNEKKESEDCNEFFEHWKVFERMCELDLIATVYYSKFAFSVLRNLIFLTHTYGYTKQDILTGYWNKWQKNMERIGKEWN